MKALPQEFGVNVRNRRGELGITQEELAGRASLDRRTIIDIEQGNTNATLLTIQMLASALEVKPKDLLETD
ncbi:transcriptional regulator [Oceanobacillus picturae]|uniref:Transcriptional regulator n=1 Tax=Oceanobacillus picturae TaxID=171693 RepID=A0A0U9HBD4_9BACI|nr:helix-turn-helix transcriptional regulator [Oceanobacillus picturae]GAQ19145.1 transcriptional regulator [Oceanobacillus picturae]